MTAAYVEVASTSNRTFAEALLHLGSVGGYLEDHIGVFKGTIMRTKVYVPDIKNVKLNGSMRVIPVAVEKALVSEITSVPATLSTQVTPDVQEPAVEPVNPVAEPSDKLTAEQLEGMSLAEVRKATGITEGGKAAIIKQYLGQD